MRTNFILFTVLMLPALGCQSVEKTTAPSNCRNWVPEQAMLPTAKFEGPKVTVRNIRNCAYVTPEQFVVHHYDKTFDVRDVRSADYIVVPFKDAPSLAHTMLSFGFEGGQYLGVSVEARNEVGESYDPIKGCFRQYELMYVLGDERDLIRLRSNYRGNEVYVYRTRATPEQARELLVNVLFRANKLAAQPEFYNTITNNCTSNIADHLNQLSPNRVPPFDYRVLLPGYSDELAYDLGLLEDHGSFAQTRRRAQITALAQLHDASPDFSTKIRR